MQDPQSPDDFQRCLFEGKFDFLDFGCSSGGSLKYGQEVLGGKLGLGVDVDARKLALAKEAGYQAINFDIAQIPPRKMVDFTLMLHFLEHVSGPLLAREFILKACQISKQFVLLRQPNFDADAYLFRKGLKMYCSDWHGHPNMMSSLSIYQILRDLRERKVLKEFGLFARGRILNSDDARILPLETPRDSQLYDAQLHAPKPDCITFEQPVFFEIVALIELGEIDRKKMIKGLRVHETLYQSSASS